MRPRNQRFYMPAGCAGGGACMRTIGMIGLAAVLGGCANVQAKDPLAEIHRQHDEANAEIERHYQEASR